MFLEITLDPWLEEHFQESFMNVESSEIFENLNQELNMIHITSEHPTYDFQVGNLVALVSGLGSFLVSHGNQSL
jgi:hypothetical protein